MNYCDIKYTDVANGIGVRVSLFVSGCSFHCEGCFNKETWDFNSGKPFTAIELRKIIGRLDEDFIDGISILGGEPLHPKNIRDVCYILAVIKAYHPTKSVWLYSGYKLEDIVQMPEWDELKNLVDVLVDGQFEKDKKDISLKFRGSSNQRIIDVKKTIAWDKLVEWQSNYDQYTI